MGKVKLSLGQEVVPEAFHPCIASLVTSALSTRSEVSESHESIKAGVARRSSAIYSLARVALSGTSFDIRWTDTRFDDVVLDARPDRPDINLIDTIEPFLDHLSLQRLF